MFVAPLNLSLPDIAKRSAGLRDPVWIDSASDGAFSVFAWNPTTKKVFSSVADKTEFLKFLNQFSANKKNMLAPLGQDGFKFCGGWIGYMAYECHVFSDTVPLKPRSYKNYPLAIFGRYDSFIYFDHTKNSAFFVTLEANGEARLHAFLSALETASSHTSSPVTELQMTTDRRRYEANFGAVKKALVDGDYFELNYTTEFRAEYQGTAMPLYLELRKTAPAPYMAFLGFAELAVLSASPECFFSCSAGQLETHPIKGTAPRHINAEDDLKIAAELSRSIKDQAELLMVTDMVRSDLGRVCAAGSVRVEALAKLKTFSHYHHLVAHVSGRVSPDKTLADIFMALFPGGSITGAPKIKVMEHIAELEQRPRGVYTGAIGVMSDNGFMAFNIPIRTLTLKDCVLEFAAGGGLVADSIFENEFNECLTKASGVRECLERMGRCG